MSKLLSQHSQPTQSMITYISSTGAQPALPMLNHTAESCLVSRLTTTNCNDLLLSLPLASQLKCARDRETLLV